MTFTVEVLAVEPHTEYRGDVYDQLVQIQLGNGDRLWLFDADVLASPEMRHTERDVEIGLLFNESEVVGNVDGEKGIDTPHDGRSKGHVYHGEIVDVGDDGRRLTVDVGVGRLDVPVDARGAELMAVGNYVSIPAIRSDLKAIS